MPYEESYCSRIEDYDKNARMTLPAVLRMLEDIASRHSLAVGDCVFDGLRRGVGWVIIEWRVRVARRPLYGERLRLDTWVEPPSNRSGMLRQYAVYDEAGEACIAAVSKFVLFDANAGRAVPADAALLQKYAPEGCRALAQEEVSRLKEPEAYVSVLSVRLRRADFDFNSHVHNLSYLQFALEALPADVYVEDAFSALRMVFRKPLRAGDTAVCKYAPREEGHTVGIYGGDGLLRAIVELK